MLRYDLKKTPIEFCDHRPTPSPPEGGGGGEAQNDFVSHSVCELHNHVIAV